MKGLADILLASQHKKALVADCVELIESHIASRSGLKGMALKTGLSMLKRAKPGILERATAKLLPEFISALDPLYQEFQRSRQSDFDAFMQKNAQGATDALLKVADQRAGQSDSATVKSTYTRMRGDAQREVLAAMPALSRLLNSYL
ncbi:DUF6918 family protein [Stenotrophobium rhamnosiphilum]|uniref:Uncharacterized protein n=1 Tax=Stenotrophobium rhamnosiphilum TaxID=2029166 RepID=A0A2T5MI02_9GAMM|nr:hypothetical protein CJD38_05885 [Stenotrophobium rhamnosiphilum]